jgi:hypothetical protein
MVCTPLRAPQLMHVCYRGMLCVLCVSCLQDKLHGGSLRFWVWVEDPVLNRLHHAELWTLTKKVRCATSPEVCL